MSDREAFRERRDMSKVITQAAKLARSKAVLENQVLRLVLRGVDDKRVDWAEDPKDGAMVTVEGVVWLDKPTAEVMERVINELRNEVA